jgi:hypothetical protein
MVYKWDSFLKPLAEGDTVIKILDNNGLVKHSIDPFSIINTFINNNIVKINIKGEVILINFSTANEAKIALPVLQNRIDELKSKVPNFNDKKVENYVEDEINKVNSYIDFINNKYIENGSISENSIGTRGSMVFDDNYLYVCIADDTWRRIPLQGF